MAVRSGMEQRIDADGILRIRFDRPGAAVNLLDAALLEELLDFLFDLEAPVV